METYSLREASHVIGCSEQYLRGQIKKENIECTVGDAFTNKGRYKKCRRIFNADVQKLKVRYDSVKRTSSEDPRNVLKSEIEEYLPAFLTHVHTGSESIVQTLLKAKDPKIRDFIDNRVEKGSREGFQWMNIKFYFGYTVYNKDLELLCDM